jgi:predicted DNA-binding transcriptional regulator AlpA
MRGIIVDQHVERCPDEPVTWGELLAKLREMATRHAIAIEALLIGDRECAALCGVSRSHWHTLQAAGKVPSSLKLGRKTLWIKSEISEWISAKCPDARTWAAMQASANRRLRTHVG